MFQFPSCPPPYGGDGSLHPPGCPIRKSVDQRLLAAPYRVSPLGTSFVGTPPLGIPQKPCLSLETVSPHTNSLLPPRQTPTHKEKLQVTPKGSRNRPSLSSD